MAHPTLNRIKNFLGKPRVILPIVAVLAVIGGIIGYRAINVSAHYATTAVTLGTVTSNLSTTGVVKAATETALAFPKGGRVGAVYAQVGNYVGAGATLATLDTTDDEGVVESAQGAYDAAEANYTKLQNGASSSALSIAQTAYDNAVAETALAVKSAYSKLLSDGLAATTTLQNNQTPAPVVSGTYAGGTEGSINIQVYATGSSAYFSTTGLVTTTGTVNAQAPQPIGNTGLSILFPSTNAASYASTSWIINIPNTTGPNYTNDSNAYTAALQAQTDQVASAKAALDALQAAPRSEDIASAQAQLESAEGALKTAQGSLANDSITAPYGGTITSVVDGLTAGDVVSANTPVIGIMSAGAFQIESYISENDLSMVSVGQPVTIVTDAYGPSVTFKGTVVEVDPSATAQPDGSMGYKVTYQFSQTDPRIKPGISATVNISNSTKTNVLMIPSTALYLKNGAPFVLVKNGKTTEEQAIATGLIGNTNVEVTSGLTAGEQVVTLGTNAN